MSKDVRQLLKAAERAGCEVRLGNGGHWQVSRQGATVTVAATPRTPSAIKAIKADLRRTLGVRL